MEGFFINKSGNYKKRVDGWINKTKSLNLYDMVYKIKKSKNTEL